MTPTSNTFFTGTEQLSPQAIALYIDAMRLDRVDDLPTQLYEYTQQHPAILKHIIGLYATFKEQNMAHPHPFFDIYLPNQRLLFKQSKACQPLEYYHEEPTFKSNSATNTINKTNEEEFVRTEKQFNWSYSFPQDLSLVVVDNEEDEKLAHIVPNGFILELPENRFPNGLYYYKLIDEEGDLVEIGSFYVFRY